MLDHYIEQGIHHWKEDRKVLLEILLHSDDEAIFRGAIDILDFEKNKVIPYEALDLQALAHFQLGDKAKAYQLIPIIKKMAMEQGVNYQTSLYLLNN